MASAPYHDRLIDTDETVDLATAYQPEPLPVDRYAEATFMPYEVPDGMPRAVFENKYARRKEDGGFETWSDCVTRVVDGNTSLVPRVGKDEHKRLLDLAKLGILPFSGRHLQHGDMEQNQYSGERMTNCSTACFSFMVFLLLLKGSGVGRSYDADMCWVDWDYMPETRFVLAAPNNQGEGGHPDYEPWIESLAEAQHKYDSESEHVRWFTVEDSAEGWVDIVKVLETAAFHKNNRENLFIFDFSNVRGYGEPIRGQQNRPASGPVPLIKALHQVASIKGLRMKPWLQALYIDHYLASCVVAGGVRRSARMATKYWKDRDCIDFIDIKRGGFLYSANNSIMVDEEFWEQARSPRPSHARRVFDAAVASSYFDNTVEPGFINVDKLMAKNDGLEHMVATHCIQSNGTIQVDVTHPRVKDMIEYVLGKAMAKKYPYIVNPCSEIVLSVWGAYCVIGDVALAHVRDMDQARDAVRYMVRFLMRVNKQDFLYDWEVKRTNRIGVGLTGIFEFAYEHFGCTFFDLINVGFEGPDNGVKGKAHDFWRFIRELQDLAIIEAKAYAHDMEMAVPHTITTIKPSGTVSKTVGTTEGAHLPAYGYYMRWVQEKSDNPKIQEYSDRGYPIKDISSQYPDTVAVGFPTRLPIATQMGDDLVTSDMVTWDQQIKWVQLLERFWIGKTHGNQVSFTLKYDPEKVSFEQFRDLILKHQPNVRCCSVMPQIKETAYAYVPEEKITPEEYDDFMKSIVPMAVEGYDPATLECDGNVCPIDVDINTE